MKKILIFFSAASFIIGCGNDSGSASATSDSANSTMGTTDNNAPAAATPAAPQTASADADKGLDLIAQSDCLTCHKVEEKVVGPAYRDVANKYAGEPGIVDSLASNIIHGGAGNWGQVPMTPHPALAKEDAQTMVKYILSLKQ